MNSYEKARLEALDRMVNATQRLNMSGLTDAEWGAAAKEFSDAKSNLLKCEQRLKNFEAFNKNKVSQ